MSKVFVFDYNKCNGCRNCQIVCKDEHCEQAWLPYSEAQPLTGQFWMNITEKVRGQVPWVRVAYTPVFCNHCAEAPCINTGDGSYRRDDGLVILDPEKSKGNKAVVAACPIGAIYYNEALDIPQKCNGCAHLLDNGWDVPRCVDACSTDALLYVEESEVDMSRVEFLDGMDHLGSKVYLYNKPQRFVAGTVFDSSIDEVVIGAKVELKADDGSTVAMLETDDMGDFKFDQVAAASYTVVINDDKSLAANLTKTDLSLSDIDIA